MKSEADMSNAGKLVLFSAFALFILWIAAHLRDLAGVQNGSTRFLFGTVFALLIIVRRKHEAAGRISADNSISFSLIPALAGTFMVITGVTLDVNNIEWVGLLFLLYACAAWALPPAYRKDLALAALLIYFLHPLPGSFFNSAQVLMQKISVSGSETMLHILNVRAWSDGTIIHDGIHTFEIPSACSGMRTSTTAFLLALGLCILERLNILESLIALILAVIQALMLNILRITAMVALASPSPENTGKDFLHKSTWIVSLSAVILLYLEILAWKKRKRAKQNKTAESASYKIEARIGFPPFWSFALEYWRSILIVISTFLMLAVAAYKCRPYHRAEMIKIVAERFRDSGKLALAEKAAKETMSLVPRDREWTLDTLRILLLSNKYDEVLTLLNKVSVKNDNERMEKTLLQTYSLLGLGRITEATAIINRCPDRLKNSDPFVAMVLAEIGAYSDKPDDVTRYLPIASQWYPNTRRVRRLYPFLHKYREWNTIAQTDINLPYSDPDIVLSASEAYMNLNNLPTIAGITLEAVNSRPYDSRVLQPLFYLTLSHEGGKWEEIFNNQLKRCIPRINEPYTLYTFFQQCFQISRPDLAWLIYRRIEELDPTSPLLAMAAVNYGDKWFVFRKRFIGLKGLSTTDPFDAKPHFLAGLTLPDSAGLCEQVPLGRELVLPDTTAVRRQLLQQALAEFKTRDSSPIKSGQALKNQQLTMPERYVYIHALGLAGDMKSAKAQLDRIVTEKPDQQQKAKVTMSELYELHGDWHNVYELLNNYLEESAAETTYDSRTQRAPLLRLCRAQRALKMGLAELHTAKKTFRLFPDSIKAKTGLTTAVMTYDSPGEALFLLQDRRRRSTYQPLEILEANLLLKTERYSEIEPFCRSCNIEPITISPLADQRFSLPAAELTIMKTNIRIPSNSQLADIAKTLKQNLNETESPFFRKFIPLWLACYETKSAEKNRFTPEHWRACGRNRMEKATALHLSALLLCSLEKWDEAIRVTEAAVELVPESPVLWRMYIGLTGGDNRVIERGRKACPYDPEIWLAALVTQIRQSTKGTGNMREADTQALDTILADPSIFSPESVTRAAEFLYRKGLIDHALRLMRNAVPRARGLLPTCIVGIRCAVNKGDRDFALLCTKKAIRASLRPVPELYKQLVSLSITDSIPLGDSSMIDALTNLRRLEPDNHYWSQLLGYMRFQQGGWEIIDSLHQMEAAIEKGSDNRTTYIIAAESARLTGNYPQAVDILKKAREKFPRDPVVLNNLAYTYASTPKAYNDYSAEAMALLPELLKQAGDRPEALDTAATVCINAGLYDKAELYLTSLLMNVEVGSASWFDAKLHMAQISIEREQYAATIKIVEDIFKHTTHISSEDILIARRLLEKAREKVEEAKKQK